MATWAAPVAPAVSYSEERDDDVDSEGSGSVLVEEEDEEEETNGSPSHHSSGSDSGHESYTPRPNELLRNYQQVALIQARRGNIIMCGATGIGKTHVALSLLREADYSNGKVAFFLATTRNLAEQQYQRIRNTTALTVKLCVGMEMDLWSKSQWQALFQDHQVVVCTAQILVNVLNKGSEYMAMKKINVLIFDECHKAHRNHPYAKVMNHHDVAEPQDRPRIFGMTATPSKHCHQILQCKVHVCPLDEIQVFAAKAPLTVIPYQEDAHLVRQKELQATLERLAVEDEEEGGHEAEGNPEVDDRTGMEMGQPQDGELDTTNLGVILEELDLHLPSVLKAKTLTLKMLELSHHQVGPWFGLRHILLAIDYWIGNMPLFRSDRDVMEGILARKLALYLRNVLMKAVQGNQARFTDRVKKMLDCLRLQRARDDANFRAIVFVQRRMTCRVVFEFLNLVQPFTGLCGFAIGQSTASGMSAFGLARKHRRPIGDFAAGKVQVLVATDVLSEGIDIPECSLVVAFDDVPNATAFVQMRGRARQQDGGSFVLFAPDRESLEKIFHLEQGAARFEKNLLENQAFDPRDMSLNKKFPEYTYTIVPTGARITLDNAMPFLNQICQWNKECKSYQLSPVAETQEMVAPAGGHLLYKCILMLPHVYDMPQFESTYFRTKAVARAVAAFHACVEFHKRGLVDDDLNPVLETLQLEEYKHFLPEFAGLQPSNERIELSVKPQLHMGLPQLMLPTSLDAETPREDGDKAAETMGLPTLVAPPTENLALPTLVAPVAAPAATLALPTLVAAADQERLTIHAYGMDDETSRLVVLTLALLPESVLTAEGLAAAPLFTEEVTRAQAISLAKAHVLMLHLVIHGPRAFQVEFTPFLTLPPEEEEGEEDGEEGEKKEDGEGAEKGPMVLDGEEEPAVAPAKEGEAVAGPPPATAASVSEEGAKGDGAEEAMTPTLAASLLAPLLPPKKKKSARKRSKKSAALEQRLGKELSTVSLEPRAAFDKGYVLVPVAKAGGIDWGMVTAFTQGSPARQFVHGKGEFWPLPSRDSTYLQDCILFTRSPQSTRSRLWAPVEATEQTLGQVRAEHAAAAAARKAAAEAEAEAAAVAEAAAAETQAQGKTTEMEVDAAAQTAQTPPPPVPLAHSSSSSDRKRDQEVMTKAQEEKEKETKARKKTKQDGTAPQGTEQPADGDKAEGGDEEGKEEEPVVEKEHVPRLHLFDYPLQLWDRCDQSQTLVVVEKIVDSPFRFRGLAHEGTLLPEDGTGQEEDEAPQSKRQARLKNRRLLAPQMCSFIPFSKSVYVACQKALPRLWRLEIALKVHALMKATQIPVKDPSLIRTALCKPDYERLEVLGDTYLKVAMSSVVLREEPFLVRESLLHDFRANLICNRRLVQAAEGKGLQGFVTLRSKVLNEPYRYWAPSLMVPPAKEAISVNVKVVADVVEALIGAYLTDGGPRAADAFLQWLKLPITCAMGNCPEQHRVPGTPMPNYFPAAVPVSSPPKGKKKPKVKWPLLLRQCPCWSEAALAHAPQTIFPKPTPAPAVDLVAKVGKLEELLRYTFKNKWLCLQALTHPSHSQKSRRSALGEGETVLISDYQRLEFLGDALLDFMVVVQLLFDYPDDQPKEIHIEKRLSVSNNHLAKRALEWLQLHRFYDSDSIELNRSVEMYANNAISFSNDEDGTEQEAQYLDGSGPKALADVLEALIAAVYIDCEGDVGRLVEVFLPYIRHKAAEEEAATSREARIGLAAVSHWKLQNSSLNELSIEDECKLRGFFPTLVQACREELELDKDEAKYNKFVVALAAETVKMAAETQAAKAKAQEDRAAAVKAKAAAAAAAIKEKKAQQEKDGEEGKEASEA